MKRYLTYLLLAVLWALPVGRLSGQTPPAPAVAPTAPIPPDPNVRRHRMGDGKNQTFDPNDQLKAAMKAQVDAMRLRVAELEERQGENPNPELEAELEKLKLELKALDSLKSLDLPEIVKVDPDRPGKVLWNRDGKWMVTVDPDAEAMRKSHGEKVTYFGNLYVNHEDWLDGPAVAILGNVHVLGHVDKDVVSIGGNVYVDGTVGGNVVAPFGDVYLNGDASVEGDVVAVSVSADDEAMIGGKIEEIPSFRLPWINQGPHALLAIASTLALGKLILCLLLGLLILAVAPGHVSVVEDRLRQKPVASFFGGMLAQLLVLPVFVLLLVTVIGIPLAILALPLLILAALLLGFVAVARMLGQRLMHGGTHSSLFVFTVGALVLFAPLLLAAGLCLSQSELGGHMLLLLTLLFLLGSSVLYVVYTAGMGAAAFSRLGTRGLFAPRPVVSGSDAFSSPGLSALPQAPPAADHT